MVHKSKRKGNTFENKMYKKLRDIIPDIKLTIGSGNSESDSDLISNEFLFELKHYKSFSDNQIKRFWKKVSKESNQHEKKPVLIYKENYKKPKVMINMHLGSCTLPATIDYTSFQDVIKMRLHKEDAFYD